MRFRLIAALLLGAVPACAIDPAPTPSVNPCDKSKTSAVLTTNPEMTAIFAADQGAREHPVTIDWRVVRPADQTRRARTQALLDAGQLSSADDFYHAAYVFQHGDEADDCLQAHALAVVAIARGKPEAIWIAAATLDCYLQRIGQPQIYGTQFTHPPDKEWTQEPYRRDLLSDALRQANGVPPRAKQEEQRKDLARRMP